MAVRFNTQFSQFVQFALRQMDAGNAKAIARYGDGVVLPGGRAITAAKGDRVGAGAGGANAARCEFCRRWESHNQSVRKGGMVKLEMSRAVLCVALLACVNSAMAENSYTNHAGNVVSGIVVALDVRSVTISNAAESVAMPLSVFPESEQRRIASDFGQPRVPPAVKRAIAGAEKAMARSRKRAEKGFCTQEESDEFCAKSQEALRRYLDRQVEEGAITPAERKALGK